MAGAKVAIEVMLLTLTDFKQMNRRWTRYNAGCALVSMTTEDRNWATPPFEQMRQLKRHSVRVT